MIPTAMDFPTSGKVSSDRRKHRGYSGGWWNIRSRPGALLPAAKPPAINLELNSTIVFLNKEANQMGTFSPTDPDDPNVHAPASSLIAGAFHPQWTVQYFGQNLRAAQTFTSEGNFSILKWVKDEEILRQKLHHGRPFMIPIRMMTTTTYPPGRALGTSDNNPTPMGMAPPTVRKYYRYRSYRSHQQTGIKLRPCRLVSLRWQCLRYVGQWK